MPLDTFVEGTLEIFGQFVSADFFKFIFRCDTFQTLLSGVTVGHFQDLSNFK